MPVKTVKEKSKNAQRKFYKVATLAFKDSILNITRTRSDDIAKTVIARIEYEYVLVAVEAKYHNDSCYNCFLRPTTGDKSGCSENEAFNSAMHEIFTYMENSHDCQFSLEELKNICTNLTMKSRTIQICLKLKYGNKIILTKNPEKVTFVFTLSIISTILLTKLSMIIKK